MGGAGYPDPADLEVESLIHMFLAGKFVALGVIFVCGLAAVFLPVASTLPTTVIFVARHAGTGVLLATSLVHLLQPANEALTDDALGTFWHKFPVAYALCLGMLFMVFFGDILFKRRLAILGADDIHEGGLTLHETDHGHNLKGPCCDSCTGYITLNPSAGTASTRSVSNPANIGPGSLPQDEFAELGGFGAVDHGSISDPEQTVVGACNSPCGAACGTDECSPSLLASDTDTDQPVKLGVRTSATAQMASLMILEAGIVLHSLFIGLSLAIAEEEFLPLAVAITLHQTFEGLGLGARLASIKWPQDRRWMPHCLAWVYACATPVGILLGMAVTKSYDADSPTALIITGVSDALSAGVLLYTGLVELIGNEFLHSEDLATAPIGDILLAYGSALFGAAVMTVIAYWI